VGKMLAGTEPNLEMQGAILAEQSPRRDLALGWDLDLRQQRVDQLLLALAQLVPARPAVEPVEGQRIARLMRGHSQRALTPCVLGARIGRMHMDGRNPR